MTWISYNVMRHLSHPTNLANHTQTSGSVLVVSASCILASLSPTVRRCVAQCLCYRCWLSAAQNWILLARRKIWKAFSKLHSKYLCLARIKIDIMYVNCSWAVAFCKLRIWVCCVFWQLWLLPSWLYYTQARTIWSLYCFKSGQPAN